MSKFLLVILGVLFINSTFIALAQEGTLSTEKIPNVSSNQSNVKGITLKFSDLGYNSTTIGGSGGQVNINLDLPRNWQILPGGLLNLYLGLSSFTFEEGSGYVTLRLMLNDEIVHQESLVEAEKDNFLINLPNRWPERKRDTDRITIELEIRGSCADTLYNSITILDSSFLTLFYEPLPHSLDLSLYPVPFYEKSIVTSTAHLVFPSRSTSSETVAAAMSLVARLGKLSNGQLTLSTTNDSQWEGVSSNSGHAIIVGSPDENAVISRLINSPTSPISLQTRQYSLTTSGPKIIQPDTPLTYTIRISNPKKLTSEKISLHSQIPLLSQKINCQPNCQIENNQIHWNIPELTSTTKQFTLSYTIPATSTEDIVYLNTELKSNDAVINVSTFQSNFQTELITNTSLHTSTFSDIFFVLNNQAIPETDGILLLLPLDEETNRMALIVTGLSGEAVYKAGRALATDSKYPGMSGQFAIIEDFFEGDAPSEQLSSVFSLSDVGYEDRILNGAGEFNIFYRFQVPLDWQVIQGAEVRLQFAHSPLLDPTASSIALYFNNTPISTTLLNQSNSTNGQLTSAIPPKLIRPGQINNLNVRVEISLENPCAVSSFGKAWVNLNADTSVHLPHISTNPIEQLNLQQLPMPFISNPSMEDLMLVFPNEPSVADYNAAAEAMLLFGANAKGNSLKPMANLGYPKNEELLNSQLLLIGVPTTNSILQEINELLPQPFILGTNVIRQEIDQIIFRLSKTDLDLGYLQLLPSPWNEKRAILAITGTSDKGLRQASSIFSLNKLSQTLEGDLTLIRDNIISSIDTRQMTSGGKMNELAEAIPELEIIGTATPPLTPTPIATSTPNPTPTPLPPIEISEPEIPNWLPFVVGSGILAIFMVLGIAYWQFRRRGKKR